MAFVGRMRRFGRDAGGAVAVWFGIAAVTLLFFAGSGLDLARSINQQAEMQGAADAAALAGAGTYTSAAALAAATAAAANYSISYYTVPIDGSVPTTTTLLYSNAANAVTTSGTTTVQLTASQKLGFLLTNTTDGNATRTCLLIFCNSNSYGNNGYGGTPGSTHLFYSHMMPPSRVAYPGVAQNCSLQVLTGAATAPTSGSCLGALPAYATVNCVQASGLTLRFHWNDMGGAADDKDYNDAVYTVACSQPGSAAAKGLVLTN